jgi:hypothetical protein
MRNLLAFLAAALLTFLGLGWYLDWYSVSTTSASGGHRQVKIDINAPKIGEDFEKGGQKVKEMIEKAGNKGSGGSSEPQKKEGSNGSPDKKKDGDASEPAKKVEPPRDGKKP